jgi:hypothetical protein
MSINFFSFLMVAGLITNLSVCWVVVRHSQVKKNFFSIFNFLQLTKEIFLGTNCKKSAYHKPGNK